MLFREKEATCARCALANLGILKPQLRTGDKVSSSMSEELEMKTLKNCNPQRNDELEKVHVVQLVQKYN